MKYQLVCPECKHEYTFDRDGVDTQIAALRYELTKINERIAEYKKEEAKSARQSRLDQNLLKDLRRGAAHRAAELQKELSALKSYRAMANEARDIEINKAFRRLVKEEIGEEAYIRLIQKADAECEAYNVSDLMKHDYTRSNAKSDVTSINKL